MASDTETRYYGAMDKLYEFEKLEYPAAMRAYTCQRVGRETCHPIWFTIAQEQY